MRKVIFTTIAIAATIIFYGCSDDETTTGSISGVVTNAKGEPLQGITVSLYQTSLLESVITGNDGQYNILDVSAGEYYVGVEDDQDSNSIPVTVTAGRTARVDIPLYWRVQEVIAKTGVYGIVYDYPTGKRLSGITLSLYTDHNLFVTSVVSDSDGKYELNIQDPDSYSFSEYSSFKVLFLGYYYEVEIIKGEMKKRDFMRDVYM